MKIVPIFQIFIQEYLHYFYKGISTSFHAGFLLECGHKSYLSFPSLICPVKQIQFRYKCLLKTVVKQLVKAFSFVGICQKLTQQRENYVDTLDIGILFAY